MKYLINEEFKITFSASSVLELRDRSSLMSVSAEYQAHSHSVNLASSHWSSGVCGHAFLPQLPANQPITAKLRNMTIYGHKVLRVLFNEFLF